MALAARTSATARLVPWLCALAERQGGAHARLLRRSSGLDRAWLLALALPAGRAFARSAAGLFAPGLVAHLAWRKAAVRALVEAELRAGVEQVVVLGAGLDPLGLELTRRAPAPDVFELDRPAVVAAKARLLRGAVRAPVLVGADLARGSWRAALEARAPFDPSRSTLYVLEGVAMYLDAARVERLVAAIALHERAPTRLVMSWLEARPGAGAGFPGRSGAGARLLRALGEPFRSAWPRAGLDGLLARAGLAAERALASPTGLGEGLVLAGSRGRAARARAAAAQRSAGAST